MSSGIENQIIIVIDGSGTMTCHIEKFLNFLNLIIMYEILFFSFNKFILLIIFIIYTYI